MVRESGVARRVPRRWFCWFAASDLIPPRLATAPHVYWLVAAIMVVAALGSALAPSFWALIGFRFPPGIGGPARAA